MMLWLAVAALAQEPPSEPAPPEPDAPEVIEVHSEGPDASRQAGAVTIVPIDQRFTGSADTAEAVQSAAGVVVRRLGGLGDFASISIRGSSARQVTVALDDIPLNPDGQSAVDLSELPLRGFSSIEVYRGGAPVTFGTTAMGGVVNLRSSEHPGPGSVALTVGSMRTAQLHADVAPQLSEVSDAYLSLDGFTTNGRFRYFDDMRTPYNLSDDTYGMRENNDTHQLGLLARVRAGDERFRLTALDSFLVRDAGVAGPIGVPTETVRFGVLRNLLSLQADGADDAVRLRGRLWGQVRQETLDDRDGEIGVGNQWTRTGLASIGLHGDGTLAPSTQVLPGFALDARVDHYQAKDLQSDETTPSRLRWSGTAGVDTRVYLASERVLLQPALQGVALHSWGADADPEWSADLLPRLGVVVRPVQALTLKANGGRYFRAPDLVELYGDRGAQVGNPELEPEHGWQVDLGGRVDLPEGAISGSIEAVGFFTRSTDLITWVQNGQRIVVPINIGQARTAGAELALGLDLFALIDLNTSATYTWSENLSEQASYAGNRLPRVPLFEVESRAALQLHRLLRLGHTLSYASGTYTDATNWYLTAPRVIQGAFVRVQPHPWVGLEVEVRNLTDQIVQDVPRNPLDPTDAERVPQAVTDFVGYPLPGRTFLATVQFTPRRRS